MKTLVKNIWACLLVAVMSVCVTSCSDDDEGGVSVDTIVGVWEGIDADYWTTNPNTQEENWWLTETEKDQEEYGEDISDYRVEFTSDQFYRVYRYDQYNDKWYTTGSNGKWKIEGNTLSLMAYDSSEDKYDEETPEVYQILELKGTKITLEYHKKTSAGETYRKVTFRQIASKEDMADEQKGDEGNGLAGNVGTAELLTGGVWTIISDEGYRKGVEDEEWSDTYPNGTGETIIFDEDGTVRGNSYTEPDCHWAYSGNRLTITWSNWEVEGGSETDAYTVLEMTEDRLVLEMHVFDPEDGEEFYSKSVFVR